MRCPSQQKLAGRQGRNHVSKVGVQFLGIGYYYPSAEKLDRSTQFSAVGYIITLYSSNSYVKSCGVRPNFGEVRTPDPSGCAHAGRG